MLWVVLLCIIPLFAEGRLAQARNGTTYLANDDARAILLVGGVVAIPFSARIESLSLRADEKTLLVALDSGAIMTLACIPDSAVALSASDMILAGFH